MFVATLRIFGEKLTIFKMFVGIESGKFSPGQMVKLQKQLKTVYRYAITTAYLVW
jgi:hypothetical protein